MRRKGKEIYCPKCEWHPRAHDRWQCSCHHVWNTFDTGGTCPACGNTWYDTCCLSCHAWSPHADWYHETATGEVSIADREPAHRDA